ncbi:hypothetical protein D9V37_06045 [Nocardioides mangrovicus]|uniref:Uncharacterized protein n=1 Tax=Nocardioides mangrovicus TaxID=2478913 RepID=A0A3L8P2H8_9ACTN|nr:hypothetical protein D9V37_06045 [Nocardioides mangrovicus]
MSVAVSSAWEPMAIHTRLLAAEDQLPWHVALRPSIAAPTALTPWKVREVASRRRRETRA